MGDGGLQFRVERHSGLPPYRQVVDQVRQAIRLGLLRPGDRLPSVREVVEQIAVNPNTVHRAYRELELHGLVEGRPGLGTFVVQSLPGLTAAHEALHHQLRQWLQAARAAGLDDETVDGLIAQARQATEEGPP